MDNADNLSLADTGLPGGGAIDEIASIFKGLIKQKKLNYAPPSGYDQVADENEVVNFPIPVDIAYGVNGAFIYKMGVTGQQPFSNEAFAGFDPAPNKIKAGYARISKYSTASGVLDSQGIDLVTGKKFDAPKVFPESNQAIAGKVIEEEKKMTLKSSLPVIIGVIVVIVLIYFIIKK